VELQRIESFLGKLFCFVAEWNCVMHGSVLGKARSVYWSSSLYHHKFFIVKFQPAVVTICVRCLTIWKQKRRLMKMYTSLASAAVVLLSLASCQKDSASGTEASFNYQIKTVNRNAIVGRTMANGRDPGATIEWTRGSAAATQLKFEAENSSGEVEFKQKTAQQIDLFAASSVLGNISIPPGTYNEVEFKAYLAPAGSAPALELNGSFTSGGVTRTVTFLVNSNVELKAEKKNVTIAAGERYSALNTINLSQLTRGISETAFSNATLSNGSIVLSASSNTDLYNQLLNNLNSHHSEAEVEHD
jgi:hypothetical protein